MIAAADIVQHQRSKLIATAPHEFHALLWLLYQAVTGRDGDKQLSGSERVQLLDAAMVGLEPAVSVYRQSEEGATWLNEQLMNHVTSIRSSARFQRAMDRVDNSIQIDGKTVEVPSDHEPRKQGALLHQELQKLIPTLQLINEQVIRSAHDGIHHQAQALMAGGKSHGKGLGAGSLVELQGLLWIVDGILMLSDEEFKHHLSHVQGIANGVATYSEFVKVAAEIMGGGMMTAAAYGGALAMQMGDSATAAMCKGFAQSTGLVFANVIAGIEIIHGIAVMFDPHATRQQKLDAAVNASAGSAWFIGSRVGGAAIGTAASTAILLGYAELKLMAHLYWEANVGITSGLMRMAFDTIQRDGSAIAVSADKLAKVGALMQEESDPEKAADLKRAHDVLVERLGNDVDYFISDCSPRGFEAGVARYPGAYSIFRELFAPVVRHKGSKGEQGVVLAAKTALERITWALGHAADLIVASAKQQHLGDLEHDLAKRDEHAGGHGE